MRARGLKKNGLDKLRRAIAGHDNAGELIIGCSGRLQASIGSTRYQCYSLVAHDGSRVGLPAVQDMIMPNLIIENPLQALVN